MIPDFAQMGYAIMAVSTAKFGYGRMRELADKAEKWMYSRPNIIFNSRAEGRGRNAIMISLHKTFGDYSKFMSELRADWGDEMEEWDSMLVDLNGLVLKPLSLKYLAEDQT